jgi:hypothetical protein
MNHYHPPRSTPLPVLALLMLPIMVGLHACNEVNKEPTATRVIPQAVMPAPKIIKPKGWNI